MIKYFSQIMHLKKGKYLESIKTWRQQQQNNTVKQQIKWTDTFQSTKFKWSQTYENAEKH